MQETYEEAITEVFKSEGGYTNEATDPGGPTNWGIDLADARKYWLPTATAADIEKMPKSVAEDIYRTHYAGPINYNSLPAGIDFSVLDYAVNSGVSRSVKILQGIVNVPQDGIMGPATLQAVGAADPIMVITKIWNERLAFDKSLSTWATYGHGWTTRIHDGTALALLLHTKYTPVKTPTTVPMAGIGVLFSALGSFITKLFSKGK